MGDFAGHCPNYLYVAQDMNGLLVFSSCFEYLLITKSKSNLFKLSIRVTYSLYILRLLMLSHIIIFY